MVRCLSEKEVASLSYKANETASNKCSKYFIGGALGLYLFVYKPNKQGTSLKKYKLRKRVNNKDILSPLLDNNGKELCYPKNSLQEARSIALAIEAGIQQNRADKDSGLFSYYANELFKMDEKSLSAFTVKKKRLRFDKFIAPYLNNEPVARITTPAIIKVIRNAYELSSKSTNRSNVTGYETANRVKIIIKQILDIALNEGEININPSPQSLNRIIKAPVATHHPALIDEDDIKCFIKDLNDARPSMSKNALMFMMLIPLRSGTLRQLTWSDIKEKHGTTFLHIPASKMKTRRDFQIAISDKAKKILDIQFKLRVNDFVFGLQTSKTDYAFSDMTLSNFLKTIGYKGHQTPHGLRATFSSICAKHQDEHGLSTEIIEMCLAHTIESVKGKVAAAYDRDPKLKLQKKLFDWYANFLENLEPIRLERLW